MFKVINCFYLREREPWYYSREGSLCTECTSHTRFCEARLVAEPGVLSSADPRSQPLCGCVDLAVLLRPAGTGRLASAAPVGLGL